MYIYLYNSYRILNREVNSLISKLSGKAKALTAFRQVVDIGYYLSILSVYILTDYLAPSIIINYFGSELLKEFINVLW